MKILRIAYSLDMGGLERNVYNLSRALKCEQVFCCLSKKGYFGKQLEERGYHVYELNKKPGKGFDILFKLRNIIKTEKPDIMHMHNLDALNQGIMASLGLHVKRVYTHHGHALRGNFKQELLNKFCLNFCDKIILVSDAARRGFKQIYKLNDTKLKVIHNGTKYPVDIKEKPVLKKDLGIGNIAVVSIIARLSKVKDHATLLEAVKKVNEKMVLLVIGDGEERKHIEEKIKILGLESKVKMLGERQNVYDLIKISDVVVCSSTSEGISQSLMEAMALSEPIIATNVGGNPELVENMKNGLLVSAKNPTAMSKAISFLIKNKKMREKFGIESERKVKNHFNLGRVVKDYLQTYNDIL